MGVVNVHGIKFESVPITSYEHLKKKMDQKPISLLRFFETYCQSFRRPNSNHFLIINQRRIIACGPLLQMAIKIFILHTMYIKRL